MKRLILILITVLFVSCTRTVYVDKESGRPLNNSYNSFFNAEKVNDGSVLEYWIIRDKNTDVLYAQRDRGYVPIMKPDGTCLTYTEWKGRNK